MLEDGAIPNSTPSHPKVRLTQHRWVTQGGRPFLFLEPPHSLSENGVLVPRDLTPLLVLADGTRDAAELRTAMSLQTGIELSPSEMDEVLASLDRALLIENGAYARAVEDAIAEYRGLPYRKPSHAGPVYPLDRKGLTDAFARYERDVEAQQHAPAASGRLVGVVSPHIDYQRGWSTYTQLWKRAQPFLDDMELVLMFGTDHSGGLGMLTLTRQSYATPLGRLPSDVDIVDGLADAIGQDAAYAEEIHHLGEHSIELASVWMHHYMSGRECPMAPVLCGSFHSFVNGDGDPAKDKRLNRAIDYLAEATAGRRTLAVAAGDLAHVGPAFGDTEAVDEAGRESLRRADDDSIGAILEGDADAFFELSRSELDARKLCGLPPIYMMLRYMERAGMRVVQGEEFGYDQCPADEQGGSLVSIVGALLYDDGP